MPKFRLNVKTETKGPIFDVALTKAAGQRMVISINEALALEGVNRIRARLRNVLKNPTGVYSSNIVVDRRQIYRGISDNGIIYGGWLEGVSSRNATTRFKGYHVFRDVKQGLDADSVALAQPMVNDYVREMSA